MKAKKVLTFIGLFVVMAATLSSCTKSFCSDTDKTQYMYKNESYGEEVKNDDGTTLYVRDSFAKGEKTEKINEEAKNKGYLIPSEKFNEYIENRVEEYAKNWLDYQKDTNHLEVSYDVYSEDKPDVLFTLTYARGVALFGGADLEKKTYDSNKLWYNFDKWVDDAMNTTLIDPNGGNTEANTITLLDCPDTNYIAYYKKSFNSYVASITTCISTETRMYDGVVIQGKTWGDAFDNGVIEGLLVYPVAWLIYTFANSLTLAMGGTEMAASFGVILSILFVTLIVRGILILCTFKPTMNQQKMTLLQPELAKIQAKYPNASTNQYEKQKLGQEQMALYKKYKINPMSMFIVMLVQFPIFIAVWGAMQGSSILMSGKLFGLEFAASTGASIIGSHWYVALVVFVLMSAAQIVSMKLPQWLQKKKSKDAPKLSKNPSQDQQAKTMNTVNNVMIIFILFMGLSLPIAMAIYWFVSALISLLQTYITQKILANKKDFVKYKTKK